MIMENMTLKEILELPYGSMDQQNALDAWYDKFMRFCRRDCRWFIHEEIWDLVHKDSAVYQARRRYTAINGF
jgi:tRNA A37 N6-isopentenylltransferase MiaA